MYRQIKKSHSIDMLSIQIDTKTNELRLLDTSEFSKHCVEHCICLNSYLY